MKKKLFLLFLCLISVFAFATALTACGDTDVNNNNGATGSNSPETITLDKLSLTMYAGESYDLAVSVTPSNASLDAITWTSTDPEIATVNAGKIIAHSVGNAIIRAEAPNARPAVCNVTVKAKALTEEELFSLVKLNIPELPMLIKYTDPDTGKSAIIRLNDAVIRMFETREPSKGEDVVQVFLKFNAEKVYDDDGVNGLNPLHMNIQVSPRDSDVSQIYTITKEGVTALKVGEKVPLSNPEKAANVSILPNEFGISFYVREYKKTREIDINFDFTLKENEQEVNANNIVTEIPLMPDSPEYEEMIKALISVKLPEFPIRVNYTDPTTGKSAIAQINEAVVRIREVTLEGGEKVARIFLKFDVTKLQDSDGIDGKNPIYFTATVKNEEGKTLDFEFKKSGESAIKVGERVPLSNPDSVFDVEIGEGELGFVFDVRDYLGGKRAIEIEVSGADGDDIIVEKPDEPENPGDEPENPGDEPENPGEEPENPGDEPENPGNEPENPGEEPENPDVPKVTTITLSNQNLYLEPEKSFTLTATLTDANGNEVTSANILWESTDESIVTCVNGVVTAHKIGMAAIYAKVDGELQVCMVTVLEANRMVVLDMPDFPIELEYTDPTTGKKTGFTILGYTAEYELDYTQGDGNFVRVNIKLKVKKTYDTDGDQSESPIKFVLNIYELEELKQSAEMGDDRITVGTETEIEYIFGSRFHEGKRSFVLEFVPKA